MADITMCQNTDCPLYGNCYRARAEASNRQSYMDFQFVRTPEGVYCAGYWPSRTTTSDSTKDAQSPAQGEAIELVGM